MRIEKFDWQTVYKLTNEDLKKSIEEFSDLLISKLSEQLLNKNYACNLNLAYKVIYHLISQKNINKDCLRNSDFEKALDIMCLKRAKKLKLPLLSSNKNGKVYQGTIKSLGGIAPYEYADATYEMRQTNKPYEIIVAYLQN